MTPGRVLFLYHKKHNDVIKAYNNFLEKINGGG